MTVCIGVLCNNSKEVIVAADRMITATFPPIEFEHGMPKIEVICPTCVVLTAGDALAHADLCRAVRATMGMISRPRIAMITEEVRKVYTRQRLKTIEERLLAPRGWTLREFYETHVRHMPGELVITIDHQISNYNYGLDIIVAGVDMDEAHIYGIRHPGEVSCYDSLGYHAIGIGAMHAVSSLVACGCLPTVNSKLAVYLTYEAKRNAESAPGVGQDTDMAIIKVDGQRRLSNDEMEQLKQIYDSRRVRQTEQFQQAVEQLPF